MHSKQDAFAQNGIQTQIKMHDDCLDGKQNYVPLKYLLGKFIANQHDVIPKRMNAATRPIIHYN